MSLGREKKEGVGKRDTETHYSREPPGTASQCRARGKEGRRHQKGKGGEESQALAQRRKRPGTAGEYRCTRWGQL